MLVISTSGNSENLISAVKKALDQKGVLTPARKLTGANTGKPKSFGTMTISRILQTDQLPSAM